MNSDSRFRGLAGPGSFTGIAAVVIGCGRMGALRAHALNHLGARVAYVYDPDKGKAIDLASSVGTCAVLNCFDDLPFDKVNAVFVCTPPAAHPEVAIRVLKNGKGLFVEKPLAVNAASAKPIIDVYQQSSCVFSVGYMNRCRPSVVETRARLSMTPILASSAYWFGEPYSVDWWKIEKESGGAFNEQATHIVDLLRHVVGDITEVHAFSTPGNVERDPARVTVAVALKFVNNSLGSIVYSSQAEKKHIGVKFFTATQIFALEGWNLKLVSPGLATKYNFVSSNKDHIFLIETENFLSALARDKPGEVHCAPEDAFNTQIVVDSINWSIRTGKAVDVAGFSNKAAP